MILEAGKTLKSQDILLPVSMALCQAHSGQRAVPTRFLYKKDGSTENRIRTTPLPPGS